MGDKKAIITINKKWTTLMLFVTIIVGMIIATSVVHGEEEGSGQTPGMNVHAIKLIDKHGKPGKGDAVLVESAGEFLLMDTAYGNYPRQASDHPSTAESIIGYLNKVEAGSEKILDVYISHPHVDHYGGLQNICEAGIKIRNLYLPAITIANAVQDRSFIYGVAEELKDNLNVENIVFLAPKSMNIANTQSSLKIGNAVVNIIGPIKTYDSIFGTIIQRENNNSLCAMVTCGNFKFLTMGDALAASESDMVSKYGYGLKADLMKQNHHGHSGANTAKLVNMVKPNKAFSCSEKSGYFSVVVQRNYSVYGDAFSMADMRETVVFQKNPITKRLEKSCCSHDVRKKSFSRVGGGLTSRTLKVYCAECKRTCSLRENHACTHRYNRYGKCVNRPYCKHWCSHGSWKKGRCTICRYKCRHIKINKKTHKFVKKKGRYVRMWKKSTSRCKYCKTKCKHKRIKKKTGICKTCKKKVKKIRKKNKKNKKNKKKRKVRKVKK